jgi:hypothetical protein
LNRPGDAVAPASLSRAKREASGGTRKRGTTRQQRDFGLADGVSRFAGGVANRARRFAGRVPGRLGRIPGRLDGSRFARTTTRARLATRARFPAFGFVG